MRNLLSKIDKIGLLLCLLIFSHCVFEIYLLYRSSETDWSIRNFYWRFYVYIFCGLLLIFRSNWSKFAALLCSLLIFGSFFVESRIRIGNLLHFGIENLLHFIFQVDFFSIVPFFMLMIAAIYSFYSIMANLFVGRRRKITLK